MATDVRTAVTLGGRWHVGMVLKMLCSFIWVIATPPHTHARTISCIFKIRVLYGSYASKIVTNIFPWSAHHSGM